MVMEGHMTWLVSLIRKCQGTGTNLVAEDQGRARRAVCCLYNLAEDDGCLDSLRAVCGREDCDGSSGTWLRLLESPVFYSVLISACGLLARLRLPLQPKTLTRVVTSILWSHGGSASVALALLCLWDVYVHNTTTLTTPADTAPLLDVLCHLVILHIDRCSYLLVHLLSAILQMTGPGFEIDSALRGKLRDALLFVESHDHGKDIKDKSAEILRRL